MRSNTLQSQPGQGLGVVGKIPLVLFGRSYGEDKVGAELPVDKQR